MPDSLHRIFVAAPVADEQIVLDGPEAHHLLHVYRGTRGMLVCLFDNTGYEYTARIECCRRHDVELKVLSRQHVDRELPGTLTIGAALPKGDRQTFLIEKSVELGVASLVPLITERGIAQPTDGALRRLQQTVIQASKQCGRNRLLQILEPQLATIWFAELPAATQRWIAHPDDRMNTAQIGDLSLSDPRIYCAIGPEGGFSPDEFQQALRFGWKQLHLGPRRLRVETAVVTAAALWSRALEMARS